MDMRSHVSRNGLVMLGCGKMGLGHAGRLAGGQGPAGQYLGLGDRPGNPSEWLHRARTCISTPSLPADPAVAIVLIAVKPQMMDAMRLGRLRPLGERRDAV